MRLRGVQQRARGCHGHHGSRHAVRRPRSSSLGLVCLGRHAGAAARCRASASAPVVGARRDGARRERGVHGVRLAARVLLRWGAPSVAAAAGAAPPPRRAFAPRAARRLRRSSRRRRRRRLRPARSSSSLRRSFRWVATPFCAPGRPLGQAAAHVRALLLHGLRQQRAGQARPARAQAARVPTPSLLGSRYPRRYAPAARRPRAHAPRPSPPRRTTRPAPADLR